MRDKNEELWSLVTKYYIVRISDLKFIKSWKRSSKVIIIKHKKNGGTGIIYIKTCI